MFAVSLQIKIVSQLKWQQSDRIVLAPDCSEAPEHREKQGVKEEGKHFTMQKSTKAILSLCFLTFERNHLYLPGTDWLLTLYANFYPDAVILIMEEGERAPFSVLAEPEKEGWGGTKRRKRGRKEKGVNSRESLFQTAVGLGTIF